ncbi:MAG: ParD-like family protein [Gammaproteobacteria bacterium]|nr:ParD-like family protein [Gammaproteobacteria bacterium]
MSMSVNLNDQLVKSARYYSKALSRSVAKQIEHWAKIGQIAEENPDLNYSMIKGILLGMQDIANGDVEEYKPGML